MVTLYRAGKHDRSEVQVMTVFRRKNRLAVYRWDNHEDLKGWTIIRYGNDIKENKSKARMFLLSWAISVTYVMYARFKKISFFIPNSSLTQ